MDKVRMYARYDYDDRTAHLSFFIVGPPLSETLMEEVKERVRDMIERGGDDA